MDKFKEIVENQKPDFDIYNTDIDTLWPEIEKGIDKRQRILSFKRIMRVAAAFVIGVAITALLYSTNRIEVFNDQLAYEISPEWAETERFYVDMIGEKMSAIRASAVELDPVILEDMQLLDEAYSELKTDLADDADNEEVINAMISNYKIKLEILEKILIEIQGSIDSEENDESDENFNL
ncbi:MAG: hypothetical protein RJQ09_03035 [Cyclobacteriaceae bacterium]